MSDANPVQPSLVRTEVRVTGALAAVLAARMLGLFLLLPVFAVLGRDLPGATPVLVGLAIGIYGLFQALLQVPFGALSDRVGRKPVIVGGLLLFLVGSLLAAMAETIYGVIAGRALQGSGAIAAVVMALAADVVSERHRTRVMAVLGLAIGGSFVLSLILGPWLGQQLGLSGLFYLCAVLVLVALVVAWLAVPSPRVRSCVELPLPEQLASVLRNAVLLRLDFGIFALHLVLTAIFVVVPVLLTEELGMPMERHSLLYLGVLVAGFIAMVPLILLSERRGMRPVKVLAVALLALSLMALAMADAVLWQVVAALFLFFTAFNLLEALLPSLVSRAAPAGARGSALGVYSSCQFLGVFTGGLAGGLVLEYGGPEAVFWLAAALSLLWLPVAAGMRELPRLDNRVLYLESGGMESDEWNRRLLAVEGVLEAVVVREEGVAMLKVDPARLDEQALEHLGRAS